MRALSEQAFSEQPMADWWLPGLIANLGRWETLLAYREEMFQTGGAGDRMDPARIAVPTLLLHGDDDRLASVAIARYLAGAIPDARLVEYPGASHMLPVTHADALAREIIAFSAPPAEPADAAPAP